MTDSQEKPATEKATLYFRPEVLRDMAIALTPCMSTDKTRPYLHGVFIENNPDDKQGFLFVATDGHKLGRFSGAHADTLGSDPAPTAQVVMPAGIVAYLARCKPKQVFLFRLVIDGEMAELSAMTSTDTPCETQRFKLIELHGAFTDYRRVFPAETDAPAAAFNAQYVGELATAIKKVDGKTMPPMAFGANSINPGGPMRIHTGLAGLEYILMPLRAPEITGAGAKGINDIPAVEALARVQNMLRQIGFPRSAEINNKKLHLENAFNALEIELKQYGKECV